MLYISKRFYHFTKTVRQTNKYLKELFKPYIKKLLVGKQGRLLEFFLYLRTFRKPSPSSEQCAGSGLSKWVASSRNANKQSIFASILHTILLKFCSCLRDPDAFHAGLEFQLLHQALQRQHPAAPGGAAETRGRRGTHQGLSGSCRTSAVLYAECLQRCFACWRSGWKQPISRAQILRIALKTGKVF
uniref:Uncharacterized protein n=1 Tax=Micrurus paraensis TaxID=1970185 RepID=A0A2D4KWR3_9SAUR